MWTEFSEADPDCHADCVIMGASLVQHSVKCLAYELAMNMASHFGAALDSERGPGAVVGQEVS